MVMNFSEEEYPDSLVEIETNNSEDLTTLTPVEESNTTNDIITSQPQRQNISVNGVIEESKGTNNLITISKEDKDNVSQVLHGTESNIDSKYKDIDLPPQNDVSVIQTKINDEAYHNIKNEFIDDTVVGTSVGTTNVVADQFEEAPTSLLLADPPSGFKDSLTDAVPQESQLPIPLVEKVPKQGIQNNYLDDISFGSDSFDQAINKIAAAQESADEDCDPSSCNSLPVDLSQLNTIPSNLVNCQIESTSETIMPAQTSYRSVGSSPARPMSFSIAGYTERSNKETSYTEKLKIGRSDSSGSSSDSSLR